MSGAITNNGGVYATGNDDGEKHEERHGYAEGKEQAFKKYDKPDLENVITVSKNEKSDDTLDLAYKVAISQGMKSEEEWEEYNSKLRKDRRKDSYEEYVYTTSKTLVRQLEKQARPNSKNQRRAKEQLNAIRHNKGLPIESNLYYVGNAERYEQILEDEDEEYLQRYREFEVETFKAFHESDVYQKLHPYEVRAEIHTGENGAIHLQTSNLLGKTNKLGVYQIAPNAVREDILKDYLGTEEFERMMMKEALAKEHGTLEKPVLDCVLDDLPDDLLEDYRDKIYVPSKKVNKNYDGDLVKRVFRRIENKEIEKIALEKSKEKDVEWVRQYGVSDGVYRTGEEYRKNKEQKREVEEHKNELALQTEDIQKANFINDIKTLTPEKSMSDLVSVNVLDMSDIYDEDYPTDLSREQEDREFNDPISEPYGMMCLQRLKINVLEKVRNGVLKLKEFELARKEKALERKKEKVEKVVEDLPNLVKGVANDLIANNERVNAHTIYSESTQRIYKDLRVENPQNASEGLRGHSESLER